MIFQYNILTKDFKMPFSHQNNEDFCQQIIQIKLESMQK